MFHDIGRFEKHRHSDDIFWIMQTKMKIFQVPGMDAKGTNVSLAARARVPLSAACSCVIMSPKKTSSFAGMSSLVV